MKKILIIEDNNLNMKLFYDILSYKKYLVDKAQDGFLGYEKIKNNDYNLVILDIKLPKLNGFELLEKLQSENIKIPKTIIISASAMDEDKIRARKFNIDTYLTKPIDIKNFIETVEGNL